MFTVRWKKNKKNFNNGYCYKTDKIFHKDFKSEIKAEEFIESLEKIPNVVAIYPLWE